MNFFTLLPAAVSEWAWLFGFALVSLALVALAVLADALYEGYRERIRHARQAGTDATGDRATRPDESPAREKKAA